MARGGTKTAKDAPERRCIATGKTGPKAGLIRFVRAPDGAIVADISGKLPGRGIWVKADRAALKKAVDKRLFARATGSSAQVDDHLVETVEALLLNRVTGLISLARKAGEAVSGYEKAKAWLENGRAALLLQASDGSERGKSRLRPPGDGSSFVGVLAASELGLAFGREHVIHAALAAGGLADKIREDAKRLSGVRETGGNDVAGKAKKTV